LEESFGKGFVVVAELFDGDMAVEIETVGFGHFVADFLEVGLLVGEEFLLFVEVSFGFGEVAGGAPKMDFNSSMKMESRS
jgi:hypothetical protein